MQKLRSMHLYLGCFFAPLLIFFALSGIWQTLSFHNWSRLLERLSTIHTSHGLKAGGCLSSPFLTLFLSSLSLLQKFRSADIPARSHSRTLADTRLARVFARVRCCGQECPRSGPRSFVDFVTGFN